MSHDGFQALLLRARDGDRAAMDEILERLRPRLEALASRFADPVRRQASTSDLLQECCVRAWKKIEDFRGGETDEASFAMFRSWMSQILRRVGLNAMRDRLAKSQIPEAKLRTLRQGGGHSGAPPGEPTPAAPLPPVSDGVRTAELLEVIEQAIDRLPDPIAAQVVRMRFFEGLTIPQISDRIGLSPIQTRERHRSAIRLLRRDLGPQLDEFF